jgi:hypothetical protein
MVGWAGLGAVISSGSYGLGSVGAGFLNLSLSFCSRWFSLCKLGGGDTPRRVAVGHRWAEGLSLSRELGDLNKDGNFGDSRFEVLLRQ